MSTREIRAFIRAYIYSNLRTRFTVGANYLLKVELGLGLGNRIKLSNSGIFEIYYILFIW